MILRARGRRFFGSLALVLVSAHFMKYHFVSKRGNAIQAQGDIHYKGLKSPQTFCNMKLNTLSQRRYEGVQYVYPFHADPPPSLQAEPFILKLKEASRAENTLELNSKPVFVTVAGSLSGLNFLAHCTGAGGARGLSRIIFFDMNPWTLSYASLIVELIIHSKTREDFLQQVFARRIPKLPVGPSQTFQDIFFSGALDLVLSEKRLRNLSKNGRCALRWLWAQSLIVSPDDYENPPKIRHSCEGVELYYNSSSNNFGNYGYPKTDTSEECIIGGVCAYGHRRNVCSLYVGSEGSWLESQKSFDNTRNVLKAVGQGNIEYVCWKVDMPLRILYNGLIPKGESFIYLTNIPITTDEWGIIKSQWAQTARGTIFTARFKRRWQLGTIRPATKSNRFTKQCITGICMGAHACAWNAVSFFLSNKSNVIEVTRRQKWGFRKKSEFGVNVGATLDEFYQYGTQEIQGRQILFHILVGEGLSRDSLFQAMAHAVKSLAKEIWVLEHNREAASWSSFRSWPQIRGETRESGSQLFSLPELNARIREHMKETCKWEFISRGCYIPRNRTSAVIDNRNMLIGGRCVSSIAEN